MALPKRKGGLQLPPIVETNNDDFEIISEEVQKEEVVEEERPRVVQEPEPEFIDKKNKQIVPYGGKKSKIKDKDLDKRKNKAKGTKIFQWFMIFVILTLLGVAVFNVFFPQNNFSRQQILEIVNQGMGNTGFPKERGSAFATDFITEYLIVDNTNPTRNQALEYYYTGKVGTTVGGHRVAGKNVKQYLIIQPKVYETIIVDSKSALFKLSAYVTDTDGTFAQENKMKGRWVSFAVNVYYDSQTDRLMITKDSPTLIPKYELSDVGSTPSPAKIGNGIVNTDILPQINPTIEGYLQAYALSNVENHDSVIQYIPSNPVPSLYSGFGGTVKLNGTPTEAVKRVVYNTDKSNEWKVELDVSWIDTRVSANEDKEKQIYFNSKYVMTLERTNDGKYLVTKFAPYLFIAE